MGPRATPARRAVLAAAFARAAAVYWTGVFPQVARELARWRASALAIPDPALRELALQACAKRGNMEGAAAFATFAPRARRAAVVRATVAFQAAYNHLDVLSEQALDGDLFGGGPLAGDPLRGDPYERSRALHQALLTALQPVQPWPDRGEDRHLAAMVAACRAALAELPCYAAVQAAALRAAERVVAFQAHQACGRGDADRLAAMADWGRAQTPAGADLRWWEAAAAAGSSLGVHVMIATAAEPRVGPDRVQALEDAYFPWIGALHSLLDHLVDAGEDAAGGQRNLIELYAGPHEAAQRLRLLAQRALARARALPHAPRHELIVAAMASFYLSAPEASELGAQPVTRAVLEAFGPLASLPMAVFRTRRAAEQVYYAWRSHGDHDAAAQTLALAPGHR